MLKIRGNAKHNPPIIRICVLPTVPELLYNPSIGSSNGPRGVDCRALLDTGADGTSITKQLAEAAQLTYRGKTRATGLSGENFHRSWTTFIGLYSEADIGPLPFVLPEPLLAIEVRPYPAFDVIIGRDVLLLGDFTMKANGEFEFSIPTNL